MNELELEARVKQLERQVENLKKSLAQIVGLLNGESVSFQVTPTKITDGKMVLP